VHDAFPVDLSQREQDLGHELPDLLVALGLVVLDPVGDFGFEVAAVGLLEHDVDVTRVLLRALVLDYAGADESVVQQHFVLGLPLVSRRHVAELDCLDHTEEPGGLDPHEVDRTVGLLRDAPHVLVGFGRGCDRIHVALLARADDLPDLLAVHHVDWARELVADAGELGDQLQLVAVVFGPHENHGYVLHARLLHQSLQEIGDFHVLGLERDENEVEGVFALGQQLQGLRAIVLGFYV